MSDFSKQLSFFIKERKVNISALAAHTQIDRTLLHKYISGTRTPADIKIVESISKGLMLSVDEKAELVKAYKITTMGKEAYLQNLNTEKIINYFSKLPEPDIFEYCTKSESLFSCTVNDNLSVQTTIKRILEDADTTNVFVSAPPHEKFISHELTSISLNRPDIRITQILSFDSNYELYGNNLNSFANIIPLIIFCENYSPLINYTHKSVRQDSLSLMPNLILTSRYAFTFTNDLKHGILHTESEILSLYRELASRISKSSYELIYKKITSAPEETDVIFKINKNLFIEKNSEYISMIFEKNSIFYRIIIHEQSLRNIFENFISSLSHEQTVSDESVD